ncbi:hypothetical protein [Thermohalobacter berrensis]|uniref:Uncharacterized protein n=1 Tax=Thermohalobacter berrensis TaxID=99594 RepID=A0A419T4J1_9FIRM|nr:hypothetical protein [Thermohalobacter berrensis]RKD32356.1 hypothetical protein BET03_03350 [Thermohalobacter berrensis]
MASREQLERVAKFCSEYRPRGDALQSGVKVMNETVKSCENCAHFTEDHKCDINLTDEILTNMAMDLEDKYQ